MSDLTNINENEAVNVGGASENKEQGAAADAAQLAYLVYARKYRKKLQAEKRKAAKAAAEAKEAEAAEAAAEEASTEMPESASAVENELPVAEAAPEQQSEQMPKPQDEEALADGQAQQAAEDNQEAAEDAAEPEKTDNDNNVEDERKSDASVSEATPTEAEAEPEAEAAPETETAPETSETENSSPDFSDDSDMVIKVDSEPQKKKNTLDGIDMDLNIGEPEEPEEPQNEKNTLDGVDMDLNMGELASAPTPGQMPRNPDDGMTIRIDEQIKENENLINISARVYPEAAFDSLMREKAAITKMIDDHYNAYADEMERLRKKHMFLRMDATARAAAERSEEFKLLQQEEERYNREVKDLERRRDEAAKTYLDRKADLERIIDEFDAKKRDMDTLAGAAQRIAAGAADVTSAIANGLAQSGFDSNAARAEAAVANANLEKERAVAAAVLEKEKALADARLEAEKRAAAEARLEAEKKAAAEARLAAEKKAAEAKPEAARASDEKAKEPAVKTAPMDTKGQGLEAAEPEKSKPAGHVVVPGAIDKARDDAQLQKKLAERLSEPKRIEVEPKDLPAYIASAEKDLSKLDKEYKKLENAAPKTEAERIENAVDRLGVRRRAVERMTDKLLACRAAGAPTSVCEKHRDELGSAVARYNADVDGYKALTGHELTRAESDMAERVLRGEPYQQLPVIKSRNEVVSKEDGKPVEDAAPADIENAPLKVDTVVDNRRQRSADAEDRVSERTPDEGYAKEQGEDRLPQGEYADVSGAKKKPSALDGLSKREIRRRMNAEKAALREQSLELAESAKKNAAKSKEAAKLAKHGSKEERQKNKEEAIEYAKRSAADEALSKEKAQTEKSLKTLKDYEKYLLDREALDAVAEPDTSAYDKALEARKADEERVLRELEREDQDLESLARTDELDEAVAEEDAELQRQLSEYRNEQIKRADVDLAGLSSYLESTQKDLDELDKQYKELEAQEPANDAERIENAVARLGVKRGVVEKMTDKLLACKGAGAPSAVCEKHKNELNDSAEQYNSIVDEYKALTGHDLTRAKTDMADRILRGEEYQLLPVVKSRHEVLSTEDGQPVDNVLSSDAEGAPIKIDTVVDGKHQLTEEVEPNKEDGTGKDATVIMTEKEIPAFFKKQKQKEEKLRERDSVLATLNPDNTEDRIAVIVERLGTQRELVDSLSKDMKLAVKTGDKKKTRSYKKQLTSHINQYNNLADEYERITGNSLTRADKNIPGYIMRGEKYKPIPVLTYRKEAPDGTLLSDSLGAGTTCGAAYSLIPERQRRELEKRGVIEKKKATSIEGLSKKEARERLKAEKAALHEEYLALAESAKKNAAKSAEAEKLAKKGSKEEREAHLAEAAEYANRSATEEALARQKAQTEKDLRTLKDYENYLIEREKAAELSRAREEEYRAALSAVQKEPTEEMLEYERFRKLDKKQKREKLKEEKKKLFEAARDDEDKAKLVAQQAKEERKLAKRGTREERAEHRAEADKLEAKAKQASEDAKNAKETAIALKNEKDYERYLKGRAERAEIRRREEEVAKSAREKAPETLDEQEIAEQTEKSDALISQADTEEIVHSKIDDEEAAPSGEAAEESAYSRDSADEALSSEASSDAAQAAVESFRQLSAQEQEQQIDEDKKLLLEEARVNEEKASLAEEQAQKERELSKSGTPAERDAHKAEAERLLNKSAEYSLAAQRSAALADEISSTEAYESYLSGVASGDGQIRPYGMSNDEAYETMEAAKRQIGSTDKALARAELEEFMSLSAKEKRDVVEQKKRALLEEAQNNKEKAELISEQAKEERKLSKSGTRTERTAHRAEAERLDKIAEDAREKAKAAKAAAKSFKNKNDYQEYLQMRAQIEESLFKKNEEAFDAKVKSITPAAYYGESELDEFKNLSRREKREKIKSEKLALLEGVRANEERARLALEREREERKLARRGTRAERAEHAAEAERLRKIAEDAEEKARIAKREARLLKEEGDYVDYLTRRDAITESFDEEDSVKSVSGETAEISSTDEAVDVADAAAAAPAEASTSQTDTEEAISEKAHETELEKFRKLTEDEQLERINEARIRLLEEARANDENARMAEDAARREYRLSQQVAPEERDFHRAEADRLVRRSEEFQKAAELGIKTVKELDSRSAYEKHLTAKLAKDTDEDGQIKPYGMTDKEAYESMLSAKRYAANSTDRALAKAELEEFSKLSLSEKRAKIEEEKLALLKEARENAEKAKLAAEKAKEEKKLAKRGSRAERAEHEANAERLEKSADNANESAKTARQTAALLKSQEDYKNYLAMRAQVEKFIQESEVAKSARRDAEIVSAIENTELGKFRRLSAQAKKERIKEERLALLEDAREIEKQARIAKEEAAIEARLSRLGTDEERVAHEARADVLSKESDENSKIAESIVQTAKEIGDITAYEKYLALKEEKALASAKQRNARRRDLSTLDGLSEREKKARLIEERNLLLNEAEAYDAEAKISKENAKAAKSSARNDRYRERSETRAELKALSKLAAEQKLQAKEARIAAKSLRSVADYEKYLASGAAAKAAAYKKPVGANADSAIKTYGLTDKEAYESMVAVKRMEAASSDKVLARAELEDFRKLSTKEKKAKIKQEKAALLEQARESEAEANLAAVRAKEEKKLAKRGMRAERAAHKEKADKLSLRSVELGQTAKQRAKTAKEINSIYAYEKYLENKVASIPASEEKPTSKSYNNGLSPLEMQRTLNDAAMAEQSISQITALDEFNALPEREKKAKIAEERKLLRDVADSLDAESKANKTSVRQTKALSRRDLYIGIEDSFNESKLFAKRRAEQKHQAKEARKAARSLKTVNDYEKHLAKAELAAIHEEEKTRKALAHEISLLTNVQPVRARSAEPSYEAYDRYLEKLEMAKAYSKEAELSERQKNAAEQTLAKTELEKFRALSPKKQKERIREEKLELLAQARENEEQAKLNAKMANEERKLAKRGSRAERVKHKSEANKLSRRSEEYDIAAKNAEKTAKELNSIESYERYLAAKELLAQPGKEVKSYDSSAYDRGVAVREFSKQNAKGAEPSHQAYDRHLEKREMAKAYLEDSKAPVKAQPSVEPERTPEPSYSEYERHLANREMMDFAKDADFGKKAAKEKSGLMSLDGLSKQEKMLLVAQERTELLNAAYSLEAESKSNQANAEVAKARSKSGPRRTRAEAKAEAQELSALSKAQSRQAKIAKKTAKSLKNVSSYEKYLATKELLTNSQKTKDDSFATSAYDRSLMEKELSAMGAKRSESSYDEYERHLAKKELLSANAYRPEPTYDEYDRHLEKREMLQVAKDPTLSGTYSASQKPLAGRTKRQLRSEAKRRSAECELEAKRLLKESKDADKLAKEERKQAKRAKRAQKPYHLSQAEAYEAHSLELKALAEAATLEAAELKDLHTLAEFEKYNANKEALAFAASRDQYEAKPRAGKADFADADRHIKHDRAAINKFCREQSDYDETMILRRYETKLATAYSEMQIKKLHFGEKNRKYKKKYDALCKERAMVEAHIPKAMKAEKRDNERYYAVVKSDINKMKLPKHANKEALTELQIEIETLLRERDAVNRELIALYNSSKTADDTKNNTFERLKTARKGAKSAYNKQRKLANEIDALHIPLDEKKKIYDPMNRITQLNAEINELIYRIEREKLKGRAKNAAISSIKKKKSERAHLERVVKALSKKAKKKAYREREERKLQLFWIVILLIVVAAGIAAWYFRADIMSYIKSFAKATIPESVLTVLSSVFGGAING